VQKTKPHLLVFEILNLRFHDNSPNDNVPKLIGMPQGKIFNGCFYMVTCYPPDPFVGEPGAGGNRQGCRGSAHSDGNSWQT